MNETGGNYYPVEVENPGKKPEPENKKRKRMSQSKIKLIAIIILAAIVLTSVTFFVVDKILNPQLLKILIEPSSDYGWIFPCGEELLYVYNKGKCGLIDRYGNIVVPLIYYRISEFNEGLAVAQKNGENIYRGGYSDGKCGVIDKEGNIIINFMYDNISSFYNGVAVVYNEGKFGVINKSGEIIVPLIYNEISGFNDRFASVIKDDKWGVIDNTGEIIIPFEYDKIVRHIGNGFFATSTEFPVGLLNEKGEIVLLAEYDWINYFTEDMANIGKNGKNGFINKTGEIVIPPIYEMANDFSDGMAAIGIPDPDVGRPLGFLSISSRTIWGFIDKTGEIVIPPQYDHVKEFIDGIAEVGNYVEDIDHKWQIKWWFINKKGEIVDPAVSEGVAFGENKQLILAKKDGKEGILNRKGDVILPFEYDNIYINNIKDNLLCVEKDGLWGILEIKK
jgi:hypothetical protein